MGLQQCLLNNSRAAKRQNCVSVGDAFNHAFCDGQLGHDGASLNEFIQSGTQVLLSISFIQVRRQRSNFVSEATDCIAHCDRVWAASDKELNHRFQVSIQVSGNTCVLRRLVVHNHFLERRQHCKHSRNGSSKGALRILEPEREDGRMHLGVFKIGVEAGDFASFVVATHVGENSLLCRGCTWSTATFSLLLCGFLYRFRARFSSCCCCLLGFRGLLRFLKLSPFLLG
mmetsp:Transcript_22516/g.42167  ORF Transcript_22516/g.42167 Transcript_22516/m.42167 type:complete len:228 (+) Transcript_22516:658-1341(+)